MTTPDRHHHALTHPFTNPHTQNVSDYRTTHPQPDGNLLIAILAVDR